MPNVKRTPLRTPLDSGRRPMRPIDREKMRPWLERHLDQGSAPGVRWVDKSRKEFEVPWRHAARQGWSIEKDACIFELWASHTRKYIAGKDKEKDPKRWKANFRCALHSLQDVVRVTGPESKGSNAVRRYRFLAQGECKHIKTKKQRKRRRYEEETEEEEMEEATEDVKVEVEKAEDGIPSPTTIPDFGQLLSDSDVVTGLAVSSCHMSGCQVIERCPSPPSPQRSASPLNSDGASDSEISNTSDEESAETPFPVMEESNLQNYHPNLWSDFEFSDSMYLGETVELQTQEIIIDLTPRTEHWDLSNAEQVFI